MPLAHCSRANATSCHIIRVNLSPLAKDVLLLRLETASAPAEDRVLPNAVKHHSTLWLCLPLLSWDACASMFFLW